MSPNEGSSKPPTPEDEADEKEGAAETGAALGAGEGTVPTDELEALPPSFPKAILAAV